MNKKGFSLIEMLTVVFIIGVLSAIALPQYNRIRERAHFSRAQAMAKSMYDSCERLLSEFGPDYSSLNEKYQKVSHLDIGEQKLLPAGFTISGDDKSISGAGFSYELDATKSDCFVVISKESDSTVIEFDGEKFTCTDGGSKTCADYGLD